VHQALQPALKTLHIGMTVQGYRALVPSGSTSPRASWTTPGG
jgi:hypothetical protein